MKNYLRLLFVGTVLLVVLGIYNEQHSMHAHLSDPNGMEQAIVQYGYLSLDPNCTTPQVNLAQCCPGNKLVHIRKGRECHRSRLSKNEFQAANRISKDISPCLLQKTGQFIYKHSGTEIPS